LIFCSCAVGFCFSFETALLLRVFYVVVLYFPTMATQPESSQNLPKIHPTLAGNLKVVHDAVKPVILRLQMT
jgi:hypothetical protein